MRLRFGVAAVSLSLAAAILLTGCSGGGGGGSTGGGNTPSPAPSGSTPTGPDVPGGSGGQKDDDSEEPALNLYEPADPQKMVSSYSKNFEFYIILEEGAGRFVKFRGPYSYCTKGSSANPFSNPVPVDSIPEDYIRGDRHVFSNYVWDCYDKKILHVKNSKGSTPIDSSKWEYRDGYQYICEIGGGNKIIPVRESVYRHILESFDGWCKEEEVNDLIKRLDPWPQELVVLSGCPFQSNLKPKEDSDVTGYFLYNGKVYFEYN